MERNRLIRLIFILSIVLFSSGAGCASNEQWKRANQAELVQVPGPAELTETEKVHLREQIAEQVRNGISDYRLSLGDSIEIMYHVSLATEVEDYRLGVNDEVSVDFSQHPQMNRTVLVRPDGKITLPIKGDFRAAGLKPVELANAIRKEFSDILNNPKVTVQVNKYSSKIAELQKAITNSPRGQAKLCTVRPDGKVYLPLLEGIKVANKTVDEVREMISEAYNDDFNNLQISVLLESIAGNQAFVFGEVPKPGTVQMAKPMTVLQVIASVGGTLPTGSQEHVKILYWNDRNEPVVRTVNLVNILNRLELEGDMIVPSNSVLFVPKTTIAKMDQFVDQYIKQLFLSQGSSVTFAFGVYKNLNPNVP
ncbi:MAG TPA: polysaccharide biosynthesis/export family protein [Syntrophobacteraceae bacterium]|nr:polysaccharide biosynthesis/export family protein [Syntrophobacteraceae bacterium]